MGSFNSCYPVLKLQCGWKVWYVSVGERADNLSLEFISHWIIGSQMASTSWMGGVSLLCSMAESKDI